MQQITNKQFGYLATVRAIIKLVWRAGPFFFIVLIALTLLNGLAPVLTIIISSELIDLIVVSMQQPPPTSQLPPQLLFYLILFGGITLLDQLTTRLRASMERLYQIRVRNYIQFLIGQKSASLDLAFFENPQFHNKLRNASSEASFRPVTIVTQLMMVIAGLVTMASVTAILLAWKAWIVPIIFVVALAMFFVSARFGTANVNLVIGRTPEARKAQYLNVLLASDMVAKDLRLFGLKDYFLSTYRQLLDTMYRQDRDLLRRHTLLIGAVEILLSTVRPVLIGYTALQTLTQSISIGQFNLYTQSIIQLHTRLYSLMATMAQLHENNLFVANLFQFLATEPDVEAVRVGGKKQLAKISARPLIEFRNVSFTYPGTTQKVIDNLTFHIRPGEAVALVGENGAGKTTIVKLLAGLYRATEGQILLDGVDVDSLDRADLRTYLSIIFQDYPIYHFSIYENIALGQIDKLDKPAAIQKAAEHTGLAQLINKLPHGYDTVLGRWFERGHQLSGGQRQLVALTRALLREAAILILDEPTSSLDVYTERLFFRRLLDEQRKQDQSILFISHRFLTVRRADRILVLENGRLLEQGNHQELMTREGGYADMFNLQLEMYMGNQATQPAAGNKVTSPSSRQSNQEGEKNGKATYPYVGDAGTVRKGA